MHLDESICQYQHAFPSGHVPKPGGDSIRPAGPPQGEGWGAGSATLAGQLPHGAAADPGEGPSVSTLSLPIPPIFFVVKW